MHIRDIPRPSQTVQVGTGYAVLTGSMRALTPLAPVHFRSYAKSEGGARSSVGPMSASLPLRITSVEGIPLP